MTTCAIKNCTTEITARSWCDKHYCRWKAHGDPLKVRRPPPGTSLQERLEWYTAKGVDCWAWTGATNDRGYGILRVNKKTIGAHRLSLELELGRPLQGQALHRCDNPPCTRPDHLYEGTPLDNVRDAKERGQFAQNAAPPGELHHNARFTENDVLDMRRRYKAGELQKFIAEAYGTRQAVVSKIVRRESWTHVP